MIDTSVVLTQPPVAYGAVFGRNQVKQNKLHVLFSGLCVVWVVAVLGWIFGAGSPILSASWGDGGVSLWGLCIAVTVILGVVGLFGGMQACLNYNQEVYASDAYDGRRLWASTVFKEWVEARYGVKLSEYGAISLLDGGTAFVWRDNERVQVRFDWDADNFYEFSRVAARPNQDYEDGDEGVVVPDVSKVVFDLMIVEKPITPKFYRWE